MRTFDEYVSLGGNCEVAFQLRRLLGRDSSSFFSWLFVDLDQVNALLGNRFAGILRPENLGRWPGGMVLDQAYGYKFHSPFATEEPQADPEFEQKLADHRSKAEYLIDKLNQPARRAYFFKPMEPLTSPDGLEELRSHLAAIGGDFALILLTEQPLNFELGDRIFNRTLERFAPYDNATDGHEPSWDRVFSEFPLASFSPMAREASGH